jgi:hypothetical protein
MSERLAHAYLDARAYVIACGFEHEIDWQEDVRVESFTESDFLRESAWVILCSGMRERVVCSIFPSLTEVFFGWESARLIAEHAEECIGRAQSLFRHSGKITAIANAARYAAEHGVERIRGRLVNEGPVILSELAFIGPVTCLHLAKNLGVATAKPDRHLLRIAHATGYTPDELCHEISRVTQHSIGVIDLVLWRYATLRADYLRIF